MSDQEIIEKHKILDSILHLNDGFMWQDVLRAIGSGIVMSLSWFNRMLETIVTKIVTLNDFYKTGTVGEFMDRARPFIWVVFFIALVVLGFQFMLNKIEKRNEVLLNIVMALCFIVIIPDLMSNMKEIVGAGIEQIKPKKESLASNMIKSNVADVLYYAEKNFEFAKGTSRGDDNTPPRPVNKEDGTGTPDYTYANRFSASSALYIPFTQKLDFHEDEGWLFDADWVKGLSNSTREVLKTKSVPTGIGNNYQVEDLAKNAIRGTKIGRETYYRYHVNWFTLIVSLLVTSFALAITAVKIGRSIFDLAFHQIFGVFIAASDLTGGQRTKKVIVEIVNTFVVMVVMIALLQLFILFINWVNSWRYELGTLGVIILMIAGAWALIDAPDIVQRQLGIDAGLRNGWQAMMGAYAASKVASGGAKAIGNAGRNAAKKTAATAGGSVNFMRRMAEGMRTPTSGENNQRSRRDVPTIPGNQSGKGLSEDGVQQGNQATTAIPVVMPATTEVSNGENSSQGTPQISQNEKLSTIPSVSSEAESAVANQQGTQTVPLSKAEQRAQRRSQASTAVNGVTADNKQVNQGQVEGMHNQESSTIPMDRSITPFNETQNMAIPSSDIDSAQRQHEAGISPLQESGAQAGPQQSVAAIPPSHANIPIGQSTAETAATQKLSTPDSTQEKVATIPSSNMAQVQKGTVEAPTTSEIAGNKGQRQENMNIPTNEMKATQSSQNAMAVSQAEVTTTPANQNASLVQQSSEAKIESTNQVQKQNRHQQHVTQRASNQQSGSQSQMTEQSQGNKAPYGHRQAVHTNTILGGNRHVQELKESVTRAGNSGFSLGQNIRRATKFVTPSKKNQKNENGGNK